MAWLGSSLRLQKLVLLPLLLLTLGLGGCAVQQTLALLATQEGLASYYSYEFQGRKTANGEIFDTHQLTAAHRSYPFGTRVRVTSLKSQKQVEVKINDRGPMKPERIIDLTLAAAKQIGLDRAGIERVRVEVLEWGRQPAKKVRRS